MPNGSAPVVITGPVVGSAGMVVGMVEGSVERVVDSVGMVTGSVACVVGTVGTTEGTQPQSRKASKRTSASRFFIGYHLVK